MGSQLVYEGNDERRKRASTTLLEFGSRRIPNDIGSVCEVENGILAKYSGNALHWIFFPTFFQGTGMGFLSTFFKEYRLILSSVYFQNSYCYTVTLFTCT